jgi:DNA recombination protein Rad52
VTPLPPHPYQHVLNTLALPLDPKSIRRRQGPGGRSLEYVDGASVIMAMNEAFTPLGWSRELVIRETSMAFEEREVGGKTKKGWCGHVSAIVTLKLHPGGVVLATHSDVGHGTAQFLPTLAEAVEKAEKEAATDAMKRAAHVLGARFGLALYVKDRDEREELGLVGTVPPPAEPARDDRRPADAPAEEWTRGGPTTGSDRRAGAAVSSADAKATIATIEREIDTLAADFTGAPDQRKPIPEGDPTLRAARWLLEFTLDPIVTAALKSGARPGTEGELLKGCLPTDATREELAALKPLHPDALEDLATWPAGDPLTRPLLLEVHNASLEALGEEEVMRLWRELGVELRRGVEVSGYQARLLVAAAGAVANARVSGHGK